MSSSPPTSERRINKGNNDSNSSDKRSSLSNVGKSSPLEGFLNELLAESSKSSKQTFGAHSRSSPTKRTSSRERRRRKYHPKTRHTLIGDLEGHTSATFNSTTDDSQSLDATSTHTATTCSTMTSFSVSNLSPIPRSNRSSRSSILAMSNRSFSKFDSSSPQGSPRQQKTKDLFSQLSASGSLLDSAEIGKVSPPSLYSPDDLLPPEKSVAKSDTRGGTSMETLMKRASKRALQDSNDNTPPPPFQSPDSRASGTSGQSKSSSSSSSPGQVTTLVRRKTPQKSSSPPDGKEGSQRKRQGSFRAMSLADYRETIKEQSPSSKSSKSGSQSESEGSIRRGRRSLVAVASHPPPAPKEPGMGSPDEGIDIANSWKTPKLSNRKTEADVQEQSDHKRSTAVGEMEEMLLTPSGRPARTRSLRLEETASRVSSTSPMSYRRRFPTEFQPLSSGRTSSTRSFHSSPGSGRRRGRRTIETSLMADMDATPTRTRSDDGGILASNLQRLSIVARRDRSLFNSSHNRSMSSHMSIGSTISEFSGHTTHTAATNNSGRVSLASYREREGRVELPMSSPSGSPILSPASSESLHASFSSDDDASLQLLIHPPYSFNESDVGGVPEDASICSESESPDGDDIDDE